jgi:flagellar basal-body rod protein FlgB
MPTWSFNEEGPAMPLSLEAVTTAALSAALDAASRRHALIATNIANADTEGYAPARLSFEAQLQEAQAALREQGRLDEPGLGVLRSLSEAAPEPGAPGATVKLDAEMTQLAHNAVRFQALAQGLVRHLSLLALAAADGRK